MIYLFYSNYSEMLQPVSFFSAVPSHVLTFAASSCVTVWILSLTPENFLLLPAAVFTESVFNRNDINNYKIKIVREKVFQIQPTRTYLKVQATSRFKLGICLPIILCLSYLSLKGTSIGFLLLVLKHGTCLTLNHYFKLI